MRLISAIRVLNLAAEQTEARRAAIFKRVVLFLATNLTILITLSISMRLLGIDTILTEISGLTLRALLVFAAIIGFAGCFISLAISKWSAKFLTAAQLIDRPRDQTEAWLVDTVRRQSQRAGIRMPEVAIYDLPDMNAFATGVSRNAALLAVSTGLLRSMQADEFEAVVGHEIRHVANGGMVTLALVQGAVDTFVIFLSRVVGYVVDRTVSGTRGSMVRLMVYHPRRRACVGHSGDQGSDAGEPHAPVPRRCRRCQAGRTRKDDRSTAALPGRHRSAAPARPARSLRHFRTHGSRSGSAVHVTPAA